MPTQNTWTGGTSTAWNNAANWSEANWPGDTGHEDHDVIIPDTSSIHNPTLGGSYTLNSLTLSHSNATLVGGGYKLTLAGEGTASSGTNHYALRNLGIISGNLDIDFTYAGETAATFNGSSGTFQHVRVNTASADVNQDGTATLASLTVVANSTYDTGNNALTIEEGNLSVSGTLLLNNATVVVSDNSSALSISNTGTVTCVNTNLTVNAVSLGQGTFTAPSASGSFIIDGEKDGLAFDYDGNGFVHNSGTIEFKTQDTTLVDFTPNSAADIDINNVTINHASCIATLPSAGGIGGDLTITAGKFDCAGYDLTVGSITIASGAEFRASSGTTTITAENLDAGVGSGAGFAWDNLGTFTHNNGKVVIDTAGNNHTLVKETTFYDLEVNMTSNTREAKFRPTSGTHSEILNNFTLTQGIYEMHVDGDTLDIYGLTTIEADGQFLKDAEHTGLVTHHGLVTNRGNYMLKDGVTVKMNGGFRQLGTFTTP